MRIFGLDITRSRPEARNAEDPRIPVSATNFWAKFGITSAPLGAVTIETALQVPAVAAAVAFLPRTLAALPLHAYKRTKNGAERIDGKLETVIHENPNDEMGAFKFWQYFWQQVFTGGRGLATIERSSSSQIEALWAMDPTHVQITRTGGKLSYKYADKVYAPENVIDVPFMLKADQTTHYGPISNASKAIQLALAMNDYASGFFAGGGVPPLALVGPLPAGAEAMKRAMNDVDRAIKAAKDSDKPLFPMPPGHELKPIGFDPEKGQMTDARRFQIEEIARAYQLPPVFLQDLTHGTFSNTEQQGTQLVKHLIGQWARALEDEMNLKLFGRLNGNRYVEFSMDGLMRGDFVARMQGLSQAVQNAVLTPNEARALENRIAMPGGDDLFIQGATVPLKLQKDAANEAPNDPKSLDDGGKSA